MKFGTLHLMQHPWNISDGEIIGRTLEQVRLADKLGYDSVWLGEHHFSPYGNIGDPLVFAPAVAAATKRVRIGLAVSVLGLHHPALIAESAAMVDHLSNGRLDFGYGSGSQTIEYEGLGIPVEEARERTLEAFEIIRRLWTEDKVSHAGRFFTVDDVGTRPRPLQRPHPRYIWRHSLRRPSSGWRNRGWGC